MKVKDVLNVWAGWESVDIFEFRETAHNGKIVSCLNMTGVELVKSHFAERELKRFGSLGKQSDESWKHYVEVAIN